MEIRLKPCPFCGGEARMNYWRRLVNCERCGATTESVDDWNRRAIETDIVEEVKRAIRDLVEEIKQPVLDSCDVGEQAILDLYDVGERVSGGLIDDEDDEEDLLEGDLEDQFEKLMGGDI